MDALVQYSIPVKGLGNGIHQFDFQIDKTFFTNFKGSPVGAANIELVLHFEKRPDLFVLQFDFKGTVKTECDRCLAQIDLPLSGSRQLLVKFSEEGIKEEAEVLFISPGTQKLNVAKYIYEYICLALPLIKVYDCEQDDNAPCNLEMLEYLERETEREGSTANPAWDELKKLKKS